jgi:tol-pal system protein YbgF
MGKTLFPLLAVAMMGVALQGCATTTSSDPLANTVYDTYRKVDDLDDSLSDSINSLQSATERLSARLENANGEMAQLEALIAENQRSLAMLAQRVDALRRVMNAELGLSGPRTQEKAPDAPPDGIRLMQPEGNGQGGPAAGEYTQTQPPSSAGSALALYDAAQQAYVEENYGQAAAHYRDFLRRYPDSEYADSAQYWLADSHLKLARKENSAPAYEAAIQEFDKVMAGYPDSPKVPSALYRQAAAFLALGQTVKATELLERVVSSYPVSAAAQSARSDLASLQTGSG